MMRALFLLISMAGVAGCGKQSRAIMLGDTAYYFPAKHISAITDPKDSGSHQFYIRLIPPGGYYWLVHAPRSDSRLNKQGPGVPTIAHVNDHSGDIEVVDSAVGKLVCRKPVNDESAYMRQIFNCGFRVYDNGVAWNVIIPGDLAASAPRLKRRAELTLADYRNDERAKQAKP